MKLIKKISTIVVNVFLVLLVATGFLIAFSLLPIKNNYQIFAVTSGSMEPEISAGSLIIAKPAERYVVGDIVTYKIASKSPNNTTTHRIVDIVDGGGINQYVTKGDANSLADSKFVREKEIIGKCYFGVAYLGYIIQYLKTLPGLILIIIIPSTIIIYEESRKIGREMRAIKKRRSGSD